MMYDISIPVLSHFLTALSKLLTKAESHCAAKKIETAVLLGDRLFPDMFALTRQVQLTTDFAKGAGARLAGIEVPKYDDNETTMEQLQARSAKTLAFLGTLKVDQFKDAATRTVTLKVAGADMSFTGQQYFSNFALPNFYFHMTTAYNILRHNGVELGKLDFMGRG